MKLKSTHKGIAAETVAMGHVQKVELLPNESEPKTCVIAFAVPNLSEILTKTYAAEIDDKSALRRDIESILGRTLSVEELQTGFDPSQLVGSKTPLIVMHKAGAGGKLQLAAGPVFSLNKLKDAVAKLEDHGQGR